MNILNKEHKKSQLQLQKINEKITNNLNILNDRFTKNLILGFNCHYEILEFDLIMDLFYDMLKTFLKNDLSKTILKLDRLTCQNNKEELQTIFENRHLLSNNFIKNILSNYKNAEGNHTNRSLKVEDNLINLEDKIKSTFYLQDGEYCDFITIKRKIINFKRYRVRNNLDDLSYFSFKPIEKIEGDENYINIYISKHAYKIALANRLYVTLKKYHSDFYELTINKPLNIKQQYRLYYSLIKKLNIEDETEFAQWLLDVKEDEFFDKLNFEASQLNKKKYDLITIYKEIIDTTVSKIDDITNMI